MRILLKGGRIVDPFTGFDGMADVLVADGVIAGVGFHLEELADEIVDVSQRVIVPGLIDLRTRGGLPGQEHREDLESLGRAAVRGGFSSVVLYPDAASPMDNPEAVRALRARGEAQASCRVYVAGSLTVGQQGQEMSEMALLKEEGAVAVADHLSPASPGLLRRALLYASMHQLPVLFTAGEASLDGGGAVNEGLASSRLGLPGMPALAEIWAVTRAILLAQDTGQPIHVGPISTAAAVEAVAEAKARGVPITAETTFHHLILTEEAVLGFTPHTKVRPPFRTGADREALIQGVASGVIDCIVTDHRPYTLEETEVEWLAAPFGIVGLETAVGLSVTHLINPGRLTWLQWAERVAGAPARILNLPTGSLAVGRPADLVVIDPGAQWTVTEEELASRGRNTPFLRWNLQGRVEETWVAGRRTLAGGEGA